MSVPADQKVTRRPEVALSENQVLMLQSKISQKIGEIQTGLSKLKEKHAVLQKTPSSPESNNQPIDLLEVYCGENSQITQQIKKLGGRAIRFTFKDGDLSTPRGIEKLWTWVELYEPEHLGVFRVPVVGVICTVQYGAK